eukprot:m.146576 g.146576  ORF g.146576 m.146576 type:complete len:1207 (-) comp16090_c2_seq2:133-3753(-)
MDDLNNEIWFAGAMDRQECDALMHKPNVEHGSFLIRESQTARGTYTLVIKQHHQVKNFRISEDHGQYFVVPGVVFPTISLLMQVSASSGIMSDGENIFLKPLHVNPRAKQQTVMVDTMQDVYESIDEMQPNMQRTQEPPPVPTSSRPSSSMLSSRPTLPPALPPNHPSMSATSSPRRPLPLVPPESVEVDGLVDELLQLDDSATTNPAVPHQQTPFNPHVTPLVTNMAPNTYGIEVDSLIARNDGDHVYGNDESTAPVLDYGASLLPSSSAPRVAPPLPNKPAEARPTVSSEEMYEDLDDIYEAIEDKPQKVPTTTPRPQASQSQPRTFTHPEYTTMNTSSRPSIDGGAPPILPPKGVKPRPIIVRDDEVYDSLPQRHNTVPAKPIIAAADDVYSALPSSRMTVSNPVTANLPLPTPPPPKQQPAHAPTPESEPTPSYLNQAALKQQQSEGEATSQVHSAYGNQAALEENDTVAPTVDFLSLDDTYGNQDIIEANTPKRPASVQQYDDMDGEMGFPSEDSPSRQHQSESTLPAEASEQEELYGNNEIVQTHKDQAFGIEYDLSPGIADVITFEHPDWTSSDSQQPDSSNDGNVYGDIVQVDTTPVENHQPLSRPNPVAGAYDEEEYEEMDLDSTNQAQPRPTAEHVYGDIPDEQPAQGKGNMSRSTSTADPVYGDVPDEQVAQSTNSTGHSGSTTEPVYGDVPDEEFHQNTTSKSDGNLMTVIDFTSSTRAPESQSNNPRHDGPANGSGQMTSNQLPSGRQTYVHSIGDATSFSPKVIAQLCGAVAVLIFLLLIYATVSPHWTRSRDYFLFRSSAGPKLHTVQAFMIISILTSVLLAVTFFRHSLKLGVNPNDTTMSRLLVYIASFLAVCLLIALAVFRSLFENSSAGHAVGATAAALVFSVALILVSVPVTNRFITQRWLKFAQVRMRDPWPIVVLVVSLVTFALSVAALCLLWTGSSLHRMRYHGPYSRHLFAIQHLLAFDASFSLICGIFSILLLLDARGNLALESSLLGRVFSLHAPPMMLILMGMNGVFALSSVIIWLVHGPSTFGVGIQLAAAECVICFLFLAVSKVLSATRVHVMPTKEHLASPSETNVYRNHSDTISVMSRLSKENQEIGMLENPLVKSPEPEPQRPQVMIPQYYTNQDAITQQEDTTRFNVHVPGFMPDASTDALAKVQLVGVNTQASAVDPSLDLDQEDLYETLDT